MGMGGDGEVGSTKMSTEQIEAREKRKKQGGWVGMGVGGAGGGLERRRQRRGEKEWYEKGETRH